MRAPKMDKIDSEIKVAARKAAEWKRLQQPDNTGGVVSTYCAMRTNSFLRHTPHGVVKVLHRSPV